MTYLDLCACPKYANDFYKLQKKGSEEDKGHDNTIIMC